MAQIGEIRQPIAPLLRDVTFHMRLAGLPAFKARLWLGTRMLRLSAWIIGCGVEIETEDENAFKVIDGKPPRRSEVGHRLYRHDVGQRLRVFLDGAEQDMVVAYDADKGTMERYTADHAREIVHGRVTVEWRK